MRYFKPTTHTVGDQTMTFRPVMAYGVPGKQDYLKRLGIDPHKLWLPSGNLPMDPSAVAADFLSPHRRMLSSRTRSTRWSLRSAPRLGGTTRWVALRWRNARRGRLAEVDDGHEGDLHGRGLADKLVQLVRRVGVVDVVEAERLCVLEQRLLRGLVDEAQSFF